MHPLDANHRLRRLEWLAAGMSQDEIVADFPEPTPEDIQACLEFAADREHLLSSFQAA